MKKKVQRQQQSQNNPFLPRFHAELINSPKFKSLEELQDILTHITEDTYLEAMTRIRSLMCHIGDNMYTLAKEILSACDQCPKQIELYFKIISNFEIDGIRKHIQHSIDKDKRIYPTEIVKMLKKTGNYTVKDDLSQYLTPPPENEMFNKLITLLKNDDTESMISIISLPCENFNINEKYPFNSERTDLIELACLFGSIKCFRYLVQNSPQELMNQCLKNAIHGGNTEIIQILEQYHVETSPESIEIAIKYRNSEIFDWLLEKFGGVYAQNDQNRMNKLFIDCICSRFLHGIKAIKTFNIDQVFTVAIAQEFIEIVELCLKYNDIFQFDITKKYEYALTFNYIPVIKLFLDRGLVSDDQKSITYYLQSSHPDEDTIKMLLEYPDMKCDGALVNASQYASGNIMRTIAEHPSVDINQIYGDKNALGVACHSGNDDAVKYLLSCPGINVNGTEKCNPLALAAHNGFYTIVQMLLDHPDINVNGFKGNNPLNRAISHSQFTCNKAVNIDVPTHHPKTIKLLLSVEGIDVNAEGADNPLCEMCLRDSRQLNLLLKKKEVMINGNNSMHPLYIVCERLHFNQFKILMKHKDIDPNGIKGNRPLIGLIYAKGFYSNSPEKQIEMLNILLKHPKLNVNGFEGENPLAVSCSTGAATIVKALLNHPYIEVNGLDIIPLCEAIKKRRMEIVQMLLAHPNINVNKENGTDNPIILAKQISEDIFNLLISHPSFQKEVFKEKHPDFVL